MWLRSATVAVCCAFAFPAGVNATPEEPSAAEAFLAKGSDDQVCSGMRDVSRHCRNPGVCEVLANNMNYRSCHEYCDDQGLECEEAYDNYEDSCDRRGESKGCDYRGRHSDLLCTCKAGFATRLERYDKFDLLNCFAANGAFELLDKGKATEEDCARSCDDRWDCEGFVYTMKWGTHCWLRSHVDLLLCQKGPDFMFYLKRRAIQRDRGAQ